MMEGRRKTVRMVQWRSVRRLLEEELFRNCWENPGFYREKIILMFCWESGTESYVFRKQLVFPREVEIIASRPSILQVSPFVLGDTLFPMIQYLSGIDVQDSIALNRECDSLHSVLGQIYEGIDKNNKKIIYLPFDKIPQTNQTRPLHKFYRSFEWCHTEESCLARSWSFSCILYFLNNLHLWIRNDFFLSFAFYFLLFALSLPPNFE